MRGEDLACANCGGIVADGGCSVCRVTREHLSQEPRFTVSLPTLAFVLVLLALVLAYVAHQAG